MNAPPAGPVLAIASLGDAARPYPLRRAGFSRIIDLERPGGHAVDGIGARRAAVEAANRAGADWLMLLAPGDTLTEDALVLSRPVLPLYDAIFGAAHVGGGDEPVAKLSRLAFDTAERLPHALLNWWVPASHLVRTDVLKRVLDRIESRGGRHWRLDYLFDLWTEARCLKSAQPLITRASEPAPLAVDERKEVLRRLAAEPVYLPVRHGDDVYQLPYTGRNAGIEREQSRGLFFEAAELEALRLAVRPGARIVDVGANTGNHTIFFAGPMKAGLVTPFEPLPPAATALRAAIERNRLTNVDLSQLGIGVADRAGRARLVSSEHGGYGASRLIADPSGPIVVAPLDSMVSGPVDVLKIDVEGMEMSVLAGAAGLIARWRPLVFVEIANANTAAFSTWLDGAGYRVALVFTDKGHANYLAAPAGVA
jgi:FkbM family methyltransferase